MIEKRKNINRGYRKLHVWQDAIELYTLASKIFSKFPCDLKRISSNAIDASQSISRNIAEGYCRKSVKEYLNSLNYSLGSCGELYSCYYSCFQAKQISENEFEELDTLHYKVENQLIKLIESIQKKKINDDWEDSFITPTFQSSNLPSHS